MDDNLSALFNMPDDDKPSTALAVIDPPKPVPVLTGEPLTDDFGKARDSLAIVVKKGAKAVEDLEQLSSMSQSAEHYAALASIMKTTSDASKALMQIHTEKNKNMKSGPNKIENHLHVTTASTMEIAQMLKGGKIED